MLPPPVDASVDGRGLDPAFVPNPTVVVSGVSVFFGPKVALSELSCSFGPGVTGLLGPNGAGKTTLMRAVTGLLAVSAGRVWVAGGDPRRERAVQGHIGLVPEDEAVPGGLTPRQLARYRAALHSVADREAPDRWLAVVGLYFGVLSGAGRLRSWWVRRPEAGAGPAAGPDCRPAAVAA